MKITAENFLSAPLTPAARNARAKRLGVIRERSRAGRSTPSASPARRLVTPDPQPENRQCESEADSKPAVNPSASRLTDPSPQPQASPGCARKPPAAPWTGAEEKHLKALYPTGGTSAVRAALPHRTAEAISRRARLLGVQAKDDALAWYGRPYSETEEAIVRTHYPVGGVNAVHERLPHRSKHSISRKATDMELTKRRPPRWTRKEIAILKALPDDESCYIQGKLRQAGYDRSLAAIEQRRGALGMQKRKIVSRLRTSASVASGHDGSQPARRSGRVSAKPLSESDIEFIRRRAHRSYHEVHRALRKQGTNASPEQVRKVLVAARKAQ